MDWDHSVGSEYYHVEFNRPSEAFEGASSSTMMIDICDLITVTLNAQTQTVYEQGETLVLSGIVTNGGVLLEGVSIQMLRDSIRISEYGPSTFDGVFSISAATGSGGSHYFNIGHDTTNPYFTASEEVEYWYVSMNSTPDNDAQQRTDTEDLFTKFIAAPLCDSKS